MLTWPYSKLLAMKRCGAAGNLGTALPARPALASVCYFAYVTTENLVNAD